MELYYSIGSFIIGCCLIWYYFYWRKYKAKFYGDKRLRTIDYRVLIRIIGSIIISFIASIIFYLNYSS